MLIPVLPTDREDEFLIALLVRLKAVEHRLWEHEEIINTDFVALDYVDLIMDFVGVPTDEDEDASHGSIALGSADIRHTLLGLFEQIDNEASAAHFIAACRLTAREP
jgi:hypothetical protein